MTDDDDAPEWTADVFSRAEIKHGGEVVREASGTLTKPQGSMLERAARAAAASVPLNSEDPALDFDIWVNIARAVLMAVRGEAVSVAMKVYDQRDVGIEADDFTAMIDQILSEAQ